MSLLFALSISCQGNNQVSSQAVKSELDVASPETIALLSEINVGELLITEIMQDPEQADDWRGEWIEIYNPSAVSIDLDGLQLVSTTEAGITISGSLILPPEEFALLAPSGSLILNGGISVDYIYNYNDFKLSETEDIEISYDGAVFDSISYQSGEGNILVGNSLSLMPQYFDEQANDNQDNWCVSSSTFGHGDLGTPGASNDACSHASDLVFGDIIFTEMMPDPAEASDWKGEWFEIYNTTDAVIDLRGLELGSYRDVGETITEHLYLLPQEYFLLAVYSDSNVNGGITPDLTYTYSFLKQYGSDTLSLEVAGTEIDSISWTINDWSQAGVSLNLSPIAFSGNDNDEASFWCPSTSTYGDGDSGTPGTTNVDCSLVDYDSDGYTALEGDCDDTNATLNPGAIEVCDGIDNDCDSLIDIDDDSTQYQASETWYLDVDGDGYGGLWIDTVYDCEQPIDGYGGYYSNYSNDCDDLEELAYPDGPETLDDGIDGNCDGWDNDCAFGDCDWGFYMSNYAIIDMNLIPAGDDPLGRYTLTNDFYMMTTEVTQGQYQRVMGQLWKEGKSGFYSLGSRYPIYHTSWYMAADYANALTRYYNNLYGTEWSECYSCTDEDTVDAVCSEAMDPYVCDGFRLPTLAEWEYAARSGTTADVWTGEGSELGGDITNTWDCSMTSNVEDGVSDPPLSDYAWYCLNGNNKTVAQKLPNGFGLYDMHGNEWEWVGDWVECYDDSNPFFPYPSSSDPFCDTVGTEKARKGGDWNDFSFNMKIYPNYSKPPADRYASIGFRLVRGLP